MSGGIGDMPSFDNRRCDDVSSYNSSVVRDIYQKIYFPITQHISQENNTTDGEDVTWFNNFIGTLPSISNSQVNQELAYLCFAWRIYIVNGGNKLKIHEQFNLYLQNGPVCELPDPPGQAQVPTSAPVFGQVPVQVPAPIFGQAQQQQQQHPPEEHMLNLLRYRHNPKTIEDFNYIYGQRKAENYIKDFDNAIIIPVNETTVKDIKEIYSHDGFVRLHTAYLEAQAPVAPFGTTWN